MKQKTSQKKRTAEYEAGFTLLELLVVIAIIGLLSGVIMISVQVARAKARDAKRAADIRQMITSLEQYHIQAGYYPTGTASVASAETGAALDDPAAFDGSAEPMVPDYIGIMPAAPLPADDPGTDECTVTGRGGNNYWYDVADDGSTYTLTFCLGRGTESWPAGTRSATPEGIQ
ncbi:MAG TPA: prepilin-type N-terminal cleavage/methylation domain-containing protein [Patescibacteria group bacterium]|nr:prepilin-type N-terminal cleavage/methylation domain-containing protein [Patescibacteria group bacterium]